MLSEVELVVKMITESCGLFFTVESQTFNNAIAVVNAMFTPCQTAGDSCRALNI